MPAATAPTATAHWPLWAVSSATPRASAPAGGWGWPRSPTRLDEGIRRLKRRYARRAVCGLFPAGAPTPTGRSTGFGWPTKKPSRIPGWSAWPSAPGPTAWARRCSTCWPNWPNGPGWWSSTACRPSTTGPSTCSNRGHHYDAFLDAYHRTRRRNLERRGPRDSRPARRVARRHAGHRPAPGRTGTPLGQAAQPVCRAEHGLGRQVAAGRVRLPEFPRVRRLCGRFPGGAARRGR